MVTSKQFKRNIEKIIDQSRNIKFKGDNFDDCVSLLSKKREKDIYRWVKDVLKRKIQPIPQKKKKHDLLVFRKELNLENGKNRILLVKIKNSYFVLFNMGSHDNYDRLSKELKIR